MTNEEEGPPLCRLLLGDIDELFVFIEVSMEFRCVLGLSSRVADLRSGRFGLQIADLLCFVCSGFIMGHLGLGGTVRRSLYGVCDYEGWDYPSGSGREKTLMTPLPSYVKLSNQDCPQSEAKKAEMDKVPYASTCGSLMYAMIATRLDIAFAMGVVSRYMLNPSKKHWEVVKGIMRYLKHTKSMCICYGSQNLSVRGYTDSDYAGDLNKRRSTSGYVFTLAGGAISWRSLLQDCIMQSTTKVEYVVANEACKEAIWLGRLVADLGIKVEMPELYCDSQSVIQLAKNPVFHLKTKHIYVKYHFIREVLEDKQIQSMKIHIKDNPVDLLTKGLPREGFVHCREILGIG
ncbi:hypothetical protein L7F22_047031 [Adiantum nelumboides]|nr:hypothetical protein [Adiantum nelumboides]